MPKQPIVYKEFPTFYGGILNIISFTLFVCIIRYHPKWYNIITSAVLYETLSQNVDTIPSFFATTSSALQLFIALFLFRYIRLLGNLIGWWCYHPMIPKTSPTFTSNDVTVIVPTVDPAGANFKECILSIYDTEPAGIVIVIAGASRACRDKADFKNVKQDWEGYPRIRVMECKVMNKRKQLCTALPEVKTPITIFADDHVFWPCTLLPHILAPFEDPTIGVVGTCKTVRRTIPSFPLSLSSFTNLLGCLYLTRHNFDHRATSAIDGGVSTVSGRTSAHRTSIVQGGAFMHGFVNEKYCFGRVGPLNCDDDKFVTRWNVNHDWGIGWQDCEEARVQTTLGDDGGGFGKVVEQNLRWTRTRWRSNFMSLFVERKVWSVQPWCVYAVHLTSMVNFALFYDASLVYTLHLALQAIESPYAAGFMASLLLWILASKLVKTAPYFWSRPKDLVYLPACIAFGYFHSLIKLYALCTFWNIEWGSRELDGEMDGLERRDEDTGRSSS